MSASKTQPRRRTRGLRRRSGALLLAFAVMAVLLSLFFVAQSMNATTMVRTVLLLSIPAAFLVILSRATSRFVPYHKTNRTLPERRENLTDLLQRVDHSLILVTGSLNSAVYSDDAVVEALKCVPKSARIKLIYTGEELDRGSERFIKELMARGVRPRRAHEVVRHTVVVDSRDTKIEEFGVSDQADEKRADYFYDDTNAAKRVKEEINALKTEPGRFPSFASVAPGL